MKPRGVWNYIRMQSIGLLMVLLYTGPQSLAHPQNSSSSHFGGTTELPATGINLIKAAVEGNLDVVKDLVARGIDIDFDYGTPLAQAARHGHIKIVKYLLGAGANPNGTNETNSFQGIVLANAASTNQLAIIDLLLDAGATVRPHKDGISVLDRAAENGHLESIQKLLNAGADPNYKDTYALLLAAKEGHLNIVKAFIDAGANVSAGDGWIIGIAAKEGHLKVVDALMEAQTNFNSLNNGLSSSIDAGH